MTHVNGPVVLNPRLVEIKKNYRFMEETNRQFTYKFKTTNQSAKNKDLALQNFHILAFENKIGRNGLVQHQRPVFYTRDSRGDQISISDIQQLEPNQRNPKQPVREFRFQVAENLEDIGNTRGKFTGLDSSLSQIDISDYEDPVGYLNGQKYEKLQSRSQIYMGEKKIDLKQQKRSEEFSERGLERNDVERWNGDKRNNIGGSPREQGSGNVFRRVQKVQIGE